MKAIFVLIFILLLLPTIFALEPFCGDSTFASCSSDSDCAAGGCSGQICERKGEGTITTCEFRECYSASNYGLSCQCIEDKCQWGYQNRTPFLNPSPGCEYLFWFDDTHRECSYKQFCGLYMYATLRTFETLEECQIALGNVTTTTLPTISPIITLLKGIYGFLMSLNPIILLILGIILILISKLARFVGIVLIILALIYLFLTLF
jgi:eight-cysteine-cluster-containing protein